MTPPQNQPIPSFSRRIFPILVRGRSMGKRGSWDLQPRSQTLSKPKASPSLPPAQGPPTAPTQPGPGGWIRWEGWSPITRCLLPRLSDPWGHSCSPTHTHKIKPTHESALKESGLLPGPRRVLGILHPSLQGAPAAPRSRRPGNQPYRAARRHKLELSGST